LFIPELLPKKLADDTTTEKPQATDQQADNIGSSMKDDNSNIGSSKASTGRRVSLTSSVRESVRRMSARFSFGRGGRQTDASVETLRGTSGSDFEGYATVHRGDGDGLMNVFDISSLFCCCKEKDGLYFLLIKGYHCFVFTNEEGKAPKYAIELMNRKATIQPSHDSIIPSIPHPGAANDTTYTTIHLETNLGDIEYKFTFANMDDDLASKFCNAVAVASNMASTEQVRKRLGHEGLLNKRSSVKFAQAIGAAKAKDQPDAPVGAGEVMAGMPSPVGY